MAPNRSNGDDVRMALLNRSSSATPLPAQARGHGGGHHGVWGRACSWDAFGSASCSPARRSTTAPLALRFLGGREESAAQRDRADRRLPGWPPSTPRGVRRHHRRAGETQPIRAADFGASALVRSDDQRHRAGARLGVFGRPRGGGDRWGMSSPASTGFIPRSRQLILNAKLESFIIVGTPSFPICLHGSRRGRRPARPPALRHPVHQGGLRRRVLDIQDAANQVVGISRAADASSPDSGDTGARETFLRGASADARAYMA